MRNINVLATSTKLVSYYVRRISRLRKKKLVTGWVTVFARANHLGISPSHLGQLSLLPHARQEIGTGQSAVMLCGCRGGGTGWLIPVVDKRVGGR